MGDYVQMEDGDSSCKKEMNIETTSSSMTWSNACLWVECILVAITLALFCAHLRCLNEIECELHRLNTNLENL